MLRPTLLKLLNVVCNSHKGLLRPVPLKKCLFIMSLFLIVQVVDFNYLLPSLMEEDNSQTGENNNKEKPNQQEVVWSQKPVSVWLVLPVTFIFTIIFCSIFFEGNEFNWDSDSDL